MLGDIRLELEGIHDLLLGDNGEEEERRKLLKKSRESGSGALNPTQIFAAFASSSTAAGQSWKSAAVAHQRPTLSDS